MDEAVPQPNRLMPGASFPSVKLATADGSWIDLRGPGWRAVFVIRGAHCSICRRYLGEIEKRRATWDAQGVDVLVVSADPVATAQTFARDAGYGGRVAGGLTIAQMQALGLWMTGSDVSGLDYVHAEPGFFLIDPEGNLATAEASNLPAVRPDLEWLEMGFTYLTENNVRPRFGRYEARS